MSRALLTLLGTISVGLSRFLVNALVGRGAGAASLGTFASANATGQFLSLLWPATLGAAATKYVAGAATSSDPDLTSEIRYHLTRRAAQSAFLVSLLSFPAWALVDSASLIDTIPVALLTLSISGHAFVRGLLYGEGRVRRAVTWEVVASVTMLITLPAAMLYTSSGAWLTLPLTCAYTAYIIAGWPRRRRRPRRGSIDTRAVDTFVLIGTAGTLASAGFLQLSTIAARLTGGRDGAGEYAGALTLATPAGMFAVAVSLALFPSLSAAWARGDRNAALSETDRATRFMTSISIALFGTLAMLSTTISELVWQDKLSETADLLPMLLAAILSNTVAVAPAVSLSSRSRRGILTTTIASIAGLLVGSGFWFTFAPSAGITAIAVGYFAGALTVATVVFTVTWIHDKHRWGGLLVRIAAGYLLIATGVVLQDRLTDEASVFALDSLAALAFLAIWTVVAWPEAKRSLK